MDPEADTLQWIIQPASRNAEICLMRWHMVDPMVSLGKDDVHLLHELYPDRQTRVCVGPLVDLISEGDEPRQWHEEAERGKPFNNGICAEHQQKVHDHH